jgi:hypothetical protein
VDFSPENGAYVLWRVGFTTRGTVQGPSSYSEGEDVESIRDGSGMSQLNHGDPLG